MIEFCAHSLARNLVVQAKKIPARILAGIFVRHNVAHENGYSCSVAELKTIYIRSIDFTSALQLYRECLDRSSQPLLHHDFRFIAQKTRA